MPKAIHITIPRADQLHLMSGYQEVVETLLWGLKEIGYDASFEIDKFRPGARHIIFRGDAAPVSLLKLLPSDTIFYNLEQSYHLFLSKESAEKFPDILESFVYIRQNFEAWDYSDKNIDAMATVDSRMPLRHIPIGFAPVLQRIEHPLKQDIDVLIYGMPHDFRLSVYKNLCESGLRCIFLCGLYGRERDELIGRSKITLNLSGGEPESIFTIVRASYLLANRKLVIADLQPNLHIQQDMAQAVIFCPTEHIASVCKYYIENEDKRLQAENKGFSIMSQRNIRDILASVLA